MESKQELRKFYKARRNAISPRIREEKSNKIAENLRRTFWYASVGNILVYAAIQSEAELTLFCEMAWKDGKKLFFPKTMDAHMEFYRVDSFAQLEKGRFDVPEPKADKHQVFVSETGTKSVILVPGIAFSKEGYRIGYGAGFYDRYMEHHKELYSVGICFADQMVDTFVPDVHDFGMNEVITDEKSYLCRE